MSGVHDTTTSGTDLWTSSARTSSQEMPDGPDDRGGHDAQTRGATSIPARVVERIAEQAASEVDHIGSAAGGVLGVGARRDFDSRPSVHCDLYGRTAVLSLDVGVDFPVPLAETLQNLRDHVTRTVTGLTGLEVGRMDVDVSWLNAESTTRRRQLR